MLKFLLLWLKTSQKQFKRYMRDCDITYIYIFMRELGPQYLCTCLIYTSCIIMILFKVDTLLWVFSQAVPLLETPQHQWWQTRLGEDVISSATPPTSQQGTCEVHAGAVHWWSSRWPLEDGDRCQCVPICLLLCGRRHPLDPSARVTEHAFAALQQHLYIFDIMHNNDNMWLSRQHLCLPSVGSKTSWK